MSTTVPQFETFRGVVLPSMCDHFGHMNVRWYAWHFDDASFHLWTLAGLSHREMLQRGMHVVAAQTTNRFVREMKAGGLFVVRAAFTKIGTKSVTHLARMFDADTLELTASQETVEVFFDPRSRSSTAIPDDYRLRLREKVADPAALA